MSARKDTPPSIGFAIASHGKPEQLLRMIEGLNRYFGQPPIAIHHDDHQMPIDRSIFPPNCQFSTKVHKTGWGRAGVTAGFLEAIRLLYNDEGPDWFFTASAACYPVMHGAQVRHELAQARCDAFIDLGPVSPERTCRAKLVGELNPRLAQFRLEANRKSRWLFYLAPQLWIPIVRFRPHLRVGRLSWWPRFEGPFHPFGDKMQPFYGDTWFCATRKVAHHLLAADPLKTRLFKFLRRKPGINEAFMQTWIAANPEFTLCRDNRRWAEWPGGPHPEWMTRERTDRALASNAFLARKFEPGSDLLDYIDEQLASGDARR